MVMQQRKAEKLVLRPTERSAEVSDSRHGEEGGGESKEQENDAKHVFFVLIQHDAFGWVAGIMKANVVRNFLGYCFANERVDDQALVFYLNREIDRLPPQADNRIAPNHGAVSNWPLKTSLKADPLDGTGNAEENAKRHHDVNLCHRYHVKFVSREVRFIWTGLF
jgi:hypothetical protein